MTVPAFMESPAETVTFGTNHWLRTSQRLTLVAYEPLGQPIVSANDPWDQGVADAFVRWSTPMPYPSKRVDADIWNRLEAAPGFNKRVAKGRAQLIAGQRVEFEPDDPTS